MNYNYYPNYQQNAFNWVQGEAGAKSYLVAPNQTVTLWDSEAQTIYVKTADATGMPSIKILDYTIRDTAVKSEITREDIESLRAEIEAIKVKLGGRNE